MTYMVIAYLNHCICVWALRGGEFGVVLSSFSFSEFTSNLEIFRFTVGAARKRSLSQVVDGLGLGCCWVFSLFPFYLLR